MPDHTLQTSDGLPTPPRPATAGPLPTAAARAALAAERFPAGTLLASRYRIIARLGRGGMGEVFRADDLELGASVALKFLPAEVAGDPLRLDRLRAEVRLARQVSHPNVCRVYDIVVGDVVAPGGSASGDAGTTGIGETRAAFLTMEYIDGEDLKGLLARIGRLPKEKAVELSRQLCFALAAVHEQGIVHRDLKPANIMIDGRGRARLTDFGIADVGLEQHAAAGTKGVVSGTPAYMSPEQASGEAPTKRSDIYSLGLVLYEIFTGHSAIEANTLAEVRTQHASGTVTSPSRFVDDLDPAVERAILRCLELAPTDRPGSALAVAAALPGGDPIQAALAAGETPSPEMVAESGRNAGLSFRMATMCLILCLAFAIGVMAIQDRTSLHRIMPMPNSPEVMVSKSREVLRSLGFNDPTKYWAGGWVRDSGAWSALNSMQSEKPHGVSADGVKSEGASPEPIADAARRLVEKRTTLVREGRAPFIKFWYRESRDALTPQAIYQTRTAINSPSDESAGAITLELDTLGRLLTLRVVPDSLLDITQSKDAGKAIDWTPTFKAAGLEMSSFKPVAPVWTPPRFGDSRLAWHENESENGQGPFSPRRVEATSMAGRPIYFRVFLKNELPNNGLTSRGAPQPQSALSTVGNLMFMAGVVFAVVLGVRHYRRNRGDRRGAIRIACAVGIAQFVAMAIAPDRLGEVFSGDFLNRPVGRAMWVAGFCWVIYMAIEPPMRRLRPQALVSWVRLLNGKWRDPLVGRDVLLGATCGIGIAFVIMLGIEIGFRFNGVTSSLSGNLDALMGPRQMLSFALVGIVTIFAISFFGAFGFVGMCLLLRRTWLASVVVLIVTAIPFIPMMSLDPVSAGINLGIVGVLLVVLQRFGVLGLVAAASTLQLLVSTPMTLDFSSWQGGLSLFGIALPLSIAAWGYRASVSQSAWSGRAASAS